MHAISSYHGNRPTNTHTHKHTDRGEYNTLRRSLARSVISEAYADGIVTTVDFIILILKKPMVNEISHFRWRHTNKFNSAVFGYFSTSADRLM